MNYLHIPYYRVSSPCYAPRSSRNSGFNDYKNRRMLF